MARAEVNRSGEMEVFVQVVERGGFSSAARSVGMTPSAVSKLIARLEARLGTRLINRSTRVFKLTSEGCVFFERATRILADIEDAERIASAGEVPSGRLRLSTSASYATHVLAGILPEFLERYPEITVDIVQSDLVVDLLEERMDVAVRAGPLKSSSLIARRLGDTAMTIVAAPCYVDRRGLPRTIEELERHDRLGLGYTRSMDGWPLISAGATIFAPVAARVQANDGEALRQLVLAGNGIARLANFTIRDDLRAGRLVPVLDEYNPGDREEFHAIHIGQGGPLPSRVRVLLDFLAKRGKVTSAGN
ncbi:LysR family transcriptional regulator [Agrobacterium tumefaciens]|uniref:LysR family transcriptional regulator n=1 Tax=Agrobacterium tumefaciens TaxID=358 RepID=UPI0001FC2313|nr:LysR family transcriptional regulator [Agrobacterium tumefaciens]ADY68321.1 transcriptional regulator, LysR family [Agrobacterium tumefaciens]